MKSKGNKPARIEVDPATVADLARQFAEERLSGLRGGQVWFRAFRARGEKIAHAHGQSWSELYPEIHRLAHEIINR